MKTLYLIITLFLFCYNSFSQILPDWLRVYNSPESSVDELSLMVTDEFNNIYLTVATEDSGFGIHRVLKYNHTGYLEWVYLFKDNYYEDNLISDIKIDNQNNIIITGNCINSYLDKKIHVIKLKPDRTLVWDISYSVNQPGSTKLVIDNNSNIYVCGTQSANFSDYLLLKIDFNGNIIWSKTYDGAAHHKDGASALFVDSLQNVTVSGSSYEENYHIYCTTIQYNINGDVNWNKKYKASNFVEHHYARTILKDKNSNIYIGGNSDSKSFILKYNITGILKNSIIIDNDTNFYDNLNSLNSDKYGNLYALTGSGNIQTITKLDTSFNVLWFENNNPSYNSYISALNMTQDAFYKLFVNTDSSVYFKLNKCNLENQVLGSYYIRPDYINDYYAKNMIVKNDYIFIAGDFNSFDIFASRFSSTIGITQISSEIPKQFELSQNYPNPFNPVTNIEFKIPQNDFVRVVIYDISGKEIETLVSSQLNAGAYKVTWDGSKYTSGVYFYQIKSSSYTYTKKMVLVK